MPALTLGAGHFCALLLLGVYWARVKPLVLLLRLGSCFDPGPLHSMSPHGSQGRVYLLLSGMWSVQGLSLDHSSNVVTGIMMQNVIYIQSVTRRWTCGGQLECLTLHTSELDIESMWLAAAKPVTHQKA